MKKSARITCFATDEYFSCPDLQPIARSIPSYATGRAIVGNCECRRWPGRGPRCMGIVTTYPLSANDGLQWPAPSQDGTHYGGTHMSETTTGTRTDALHGPYAGLDLDGLVDWPG